MELLCMPGQWKDNRQPLLPRWLQPAHFPFLYGCEKVGALSKTSFLHQLGFDSPGQISGAHAQPVTTHHVSSIAALLHAAPFKGDPHLTPTLLAHKQAKRVSKFASLASSRAKESGPASSHHHPCAATPLVGTPKHGGCVWEEGYAPSLW